MPAFMSLADLAREFPHPGDEVRPPHRDTLRNRGREAAERLGLEMVRNGREWFVSRAAFEAANAELLARWNAV